MIPSYLSTMFAIDTVRFTRRNVKKETSNDVVTHRRTIVASYKEVGGVGCRETSSRKDVTWHRHRTLFAIGRPIESFNTKGVKSTSRHARC